MALRWLWLILIVVVSFGFKSSDLVDMEAAIIEQDFQTAKVLAGKLIDQQPDDEVLFQAQYYLALSHLRLNEYTEAEAIFQKLITQKADLKIRDKSYL